MPTKVRVSGVECGRVHGHSKGPLCGDAASRKGRQDRRRSGTLNLPLRWALNVKLLSESAGRSGAALFQAARIHLSIKPSSSLHGAGQQTGRSLTTELYHVLSHSHNLQEMLGGRQHWHFKDEEELRPEKLRDSPALLPAKRQASSRPSGAPLGSGHARRGRHRPR